FDPRYLHHLSSVSSIAREMEEAGLDVERRQDGPFLCCVARKPEAGAARDLGGGAGGRPTPPARPAPARPRRSPCAPRPPARLSLSRCLIPRREKRSRSSRW